MITIKKHLPIKILFVFIGALGETTSIIKNIEYAQENKIKHPLITINPSISQNIKNVILGISRDWENLNEREFPKNSRFIILIILDWLFNASFKIFSY